MTPPKESAVVAKIVKTLNKLPATYVRKVHGGRYGSGWPDVVGSMHGRMLALEVKRAKTGYGATPLQLKELERWSEAGAVAGIVTSVEDVHDLLAQDASLCTTGAVRMLGTML